MLARRIIAVSPDQAFGNRLASALEGVGGAVEVHARVDALEPAALAAALLVLHLADPAGAPARALLGRLAGETRVIAIVPRPELAAVVEVMQASDRVAAVLVVEGFEPQALRACAARVLDADLFGVERLVGPGTEVRRASVGDYAAKARCIAQVAELTAAHGVRGTYREAIAQCLDEMLMNALYDAPASVAGAAPPERRSAPHAVVQLACDGARVVIGVRDEFGGLQRATVLRYLHKCLHSAQQIGVPGHGADGAPDAGAPARTAGGAGLGLYLMVSRATEVFFHVRPGSATEVICTFAVRGPKRRLAGLGFFTASGEPAAGARRPAARTRLTAALIAAIVVTLGLVAYVAWAR